MKLIILLGVMMGLVAVQCGNIYSRHFHDYRGTVANDSTNEEAERHHHTDCGLPEGVEDPDNDCIEGTGGVDYGNLDHPPESTDFQCDTTPPRNPGFYSDPQYKCQVYYICDPSGQKFIFICPPGFAFNQETSFCVLWTEYNCLTAPSHYGDPQPGVFHPGCVNYDVTTELAKHESLPEPHIIPEVKFFAQIEAKDQPIADDHNEAPVQDGYA